MKRILSLCLVLVFSFTLCSSALAGVLRADEVFEAAFATLKTTKKIAFSASTVEIKKSISVTACQLEKKVNEKWEDAGSLTPPSFVMNNVKGYLYTEDYSSDIGTGTYRVKVTFNADGYEISRYSNERTFK